MRALVQRVSRAEVRVDGRVVGAIGSGLVVLLGVGHDDDVARADRVATRVARLRIFPMTAVASIGACSTWMATRSSVSQFTLYGDTSRGHRPSMSGAAPPELAEPLYEAFCSVLRDQGVGRVETGVFGAAMEVELVNDGPVTLLLEG